MVGEYTEIESGKRSDRPELEKALEACRRQNATLAAVAALIASVSLAAAQNTP